MGILTALDEEMSDFNDVSGGLLESAMSTAKVDGHFYGLALNTNTKILFYNVQAFKDASRHRPCLSSGKTETSASVADISGRYQFTDTVFWHVRSGM